CEEIHRQRSARLRHSKHPFLTSTIFHEESSVMTITFNNTYLGGITSQSAAFQTTFTNLVNAVEGFFNQQFSDNVTLNVSFDWQALNPGYVSGGFTLGSNNFPLHTVSYADLRNALISHASTNDANP